MRTQQGGREEASLHRSIPMDTERGDYEKLKRGALDRGRDEVHENQADSNTL